jgi:hypothetical protein
MAATTVFIDDAVSGNLPPICAKSGEPTTRHLTITQDMTGSLGALWLALFFGPPGWLLLLLVAASRRRSNLTVRLPYSAEVLGWYASAVRQMFWCIAVAIAALVACLAAAAVIPIFPAGSLAFIASVIVLAGAVAVAIFRWRAHRLLVVLSLDASGRWLTLHKVHPAFADACAEAARQPNPATRSTAPARRPAAPADDHRHATDR